MDFSQQRRIRPLWSRYIPLGVTSLLFVSALLGWGGDVLGGLPPVLSVPLDRLSNFAAVFLAIFIEAVPFLLLGTLASGIVEEFITREDISHWIPRNPLGGAVVGALLGLFLPVCECGVVPFARRLMAKGLPLSSGVAVLLAAPVINPIVIASTLSAFGAGPIFWGRLGFSFGVAVAVGVIFSRLPVEVALLPEVVLASNLSPVQSASRSTPRLPERIRRVMTTTADEMFEIGRYLVIGSVLAALVQTFVPQSILLALGKGPVLSVLALLILAVLLSICSTVDAFIALAFASTFSPGAVLAFLVFGPMVDIKSTLLYLRLFKRRPTALLVLLPFLFTFAIGVAWNWIVR